MVYVDNLRVIKIHPVFSGFRGNLPYFKRKDLSCHLFADTVDELYEFAERIGCERDWIHFSSRPHFDLTPRMRERALRAGAKPITTKQYLRNDPLCK